MLREEPLADALFRRYAKIYDPEALKMYLYQNDDMLASSYYLLERMDEWDDESVREIKRGFATRKELSGDIKIMDAYAKLQSLKSTNDFQDITTVDELLKRAAVSDLSKATKWKNELKVSEKRYFWIHVKSIIQVF